MFETVSGGLTSAIGFTDERRANRSEGMKEDTRMHCLFHCCWEGCTMAYSWGGSVYYSREGVPAAAPEGGHMVAQSGSRERLNTAAQFHFSFLSRSWVPAHRKIHFITAIEIFYICGVPSSPTNLVKNLTDMPRDHFHSDVQSCRVNNQDWPFQH